MNLSTLRGPLGWSVVWRGQPIGLIRKTLDGYQVAVVGFKAGDGYGSHVFPTLNAAKKAIVEVLS